MLRRLTLCATLVSAIAFGCSNDPSNEPSATPGNPLTAGDTAARPNATIPPLAQMLAEQPGSATSLQAEAEAEADAPASAVPPTATDRPADPGPSDVKSPGSTGTDDCAQVARTIIAIAEKEMKAELADLPPEERKLAEQLGASTMKQLRGQMETMCRSERWPPQFKTCILEARNVAALDECERYAPEVAARLGAIGDDLMAMGDRLGNTDFTAPPPATAKKVKWDGKSKDCRAVAKHIVNLARQNFTGMTPEQRQYAESMMTELQTTFADQCRAGNWPEAVRVCFLKAETQDQLGHCGAAYGQ